MPFEPAICAGIGSLGFSNDIVCGRVASYSGSSAVGSAGRGISSPKGKIKTRSGSSAGYTIIVVASSDGGATASNFLGADAAQRYWQFRSNGTNGSLEFIAFDTGGTPVFAYSDGFVGLKTCVYVGTVAGGYVQAWSGPLGGVAGTNGQVALANPKLPETGMDIFIGSRDGNSEFSNAIMYSYAVFGRGITSREAQSIVFNPWQIFEPDETPLFKPVVTAQYARPVSDVSAGGWTASTGSDLFAMLDETSANDSDYITTTSASTCEVALGSLSDPALSTGHIVRYRISATGGGIIVRLREGSTTIASWTHNPAPASPTTYAQTLSGGEADSITNYAALKLQFEAIP